MSVDDNQDIIVNPAPPLTDKESEAIQRQHSTDTLAQQKCDTDIAECNSSMTLTLWCSENMMQMPLPSNSWPLTWQQDADAAVAQQLTAKQATAFVMLTTAVLMVQIPLSHAQNLLLLFQAVQPAPPVNTNLDCACFQNNNGQFCNHIGANDMMMPGITPSQLEDFLNGPGTKILEQQPTILSGEF
jgi:hypothetical protein